MTTEHLHHEHSDEDTSVVGYPPVLETTNDIETNQTATPVEAYVVGDISSPEPIAPTSEEADQELADSQEVVSDLVERVVAPLEMASTSVSSYTPLELSAVSLAEEMVSGTIKQQQQAQETIDLPEVAVCASLQEKSVSGDVLARGDAELITLQEKLSQHASQEQESQEQLVSETPSIITTEQIEAIPAQLVSSFMATETERKPLLETKPEDIRPFTSFIEEFRLAEAARLQATLHESQAEAFTLLSSAESVLVASSPTTDDIDHTEEPSKSVVQSEQSASMTLVPSDGASTSSPSVDENGLVSPPLLEQHVISPLLRHTTRSRAPRRHHREELAAVVETPAPVQPEAAQTIPSEPPAVTTPKPARRYRFDRPASIIKPKGANGAYRLNVSTSTAASEFATDQQLAEETHPSVTGVVDPEILKDQVAFEIAQPISKPTATQETVSAENIDTTTAIVAGPVRRRPAQKEQLTAAAPALQVDTISVAEAVTAVEPVMQPKEVALEDLPPLEYAELQKANSRRRRRHRSGPNSNTSAGAAVSKPSGAPVILPMPQQSPAQLPQIPSTPVQSAANVPTYSIVSGYTVSQMNQGNDVVGPFLGPEPSPARGSGLSRDGRTTTRPGTHRTSASSSAPTGRAGDNGLMSASIGQFANVVSQAIEIQTDRMVAEFRRIGQAPTNVSVSLPPFPSSERVGVFVDVANLLYSARTLRIAVDFGKLLNFLRGNRRLIRAHAYCPTSPQPGDEQMFLQAVKGLGYRITTKNYKTFSSGAKKADLDLDLCMDVVRLVDGKAVDCIVLLSGDSDFMPMLDYCSDHGVRVEVAAFDEAMSATLRQSCDLFINLSMLEEIRA